MGVGTLILGESGTGKSSSLRNFSEGDVFVIRAINKPLPFKNHIRSIVSDDYSDIKKAMKTAKEKIIVIDDAQYLMSNEFMRRATERGYDKFTEIAQGFWDLINSINDLDDDVRVYIMAHIERDANGNEKIKTIGKMLDEKITVEGMFTIVLKTNVTDGNYSFITQNNGHDTTKSPLGMFNSYAIDNDLKYVDEKICNYYEIGNFKSDEEIKKADEEAAKPEIEKPEKRGRRSRSKADKSVDSTGQDEQTPEKQEADQEAAGDVQPPKRRRRKAE